MNPIARTDGLAWLAMTALLCAGAIIVATAGPFGGGLGFGTPWSTALDWQPGLGLHEPWRLWTSAWVHWSGAHLGVNLVGAGVVGAVGWRARAPASAAIAWFFAWPLTQLLMATPDSARLLQEMRHYGGLSGVLHAGVVVLGLALAWPRRARAAPTAASRQDTGFVATRASQLEPSRITEGPWAMTSLEELSVHTALPVSTLEPPLAAALTPAQEARHRWIGLAIVAGTVVKVLLESPWNLALRPSAMLGIDVAPLAHACGIAAGGVVWGLGTCLAALAPRGRTS